MEQIVNLHIEKLPEGVYLATSDDVPGLVAQGRTIAETLERPTRAERNRGLI
jgi:predicted RNase H-like HicB family nuclease